ncbi:MAG: pyrroline-5-carboxylate reductase [Candidatus Hodarchaeota archaeon]
MAILKIGIIGCGNMGGAFIKGLIRQKIVAPEKINVHDIDGEKLEKLMKEYNIHNSYKNNVELVNDSDLIILAVKPQVLKKVLEEISGVLNDKKAVLTIVAGVPMCFYNDVTGKQFPLARVMPNVPGTINKGVSCVAFNELVTDEQKENCLNILNAIGNVHQVPEDYLDAVTGLSGSGPAYVFYFLEGLTDGGVKMGLPRELSRSLAIDTILGSLEMVKQTGTHPILLKDKVTTPGGTTVDALHVLDNKNLRGILIEAIEVATKKSKKLSEIFLN